MYVICKLQIIVQIALARYEQCFPSTKLMLTHRRHLTFELVIANGAQTAWELIIDLKIFYHSSYQLIANETEMVSHT